MELNLGAIALSKGLCSERVCFVYDDPAKAKAAWERVARTSRYVSANRILHPDEPGRQVVIVAGEAGERETIAGARRLLEGLGGGTEIEPPRLVLEATAAKRFQRADGERHVARTPHGAAFHAPTGINLGPARRPQG